MKRVIIVDDDKDQTKTFSELLSLNEIQVVDIAHNGKDAIEKFDMHKPNVMIVDLMMPEYDGFYVLENIRKKDPKANIVILTGDASNSTKDKLEKLNPNKIYLKPVNVELLVNYIKS